MAYVIGDSDWEHLRHKDVMAVEVPIVADDPVEADNLYLEELHFVNNTANDAQVTILDRQTPAKAVCVASVFAKSDWERSYKGRRCTGGLSWVSDVAGVVGYIRGRW